MHYKRAWWKRGTKSCDSRDPKAPRCPGVPRNVMHEKDFLRTIGFLHLRNSNFSIILGQQFVKNFKFLVKINKI